MNLIDEIIDELTDPSITRFEELTKGFSTARKYVLYTKDEMPKYILKIYGLEKAERRREEFELLQQLFHNHVSCPKPIQFGIHMKHQVCFIVLSYLNGVSGDKSIPTKSPEEQYNLGLLAGVELRKIHLITPMQPFDWYRKRTEKYKNKVDECKRLGLTFYKQDYLESYIEDHIHLLKVSPVTFQHDDFHPQNMIITDDGAVSIIDFDSYDWGDPWEEFFKLPKFTIQVSPYFAKGQIVGYFNNKIPGSFWRKYNLFVALNQHAGQLGGVKSNNMSYAQERTQYIVETHDFRANNPPEWFNLCC